MDEKLQAIKVMINLHLRDHARPDAEFVTKLADAVAELRKTDVTFYHIKPTVSGYGQ
jgi:hypothetical protein